MRDMLLEFVEDINPGVLKVIVSHLPQKIRDSKTKGYTQKRDRDGKLIEKYLSSITYNSYGAIRYFQGALARYIFYAPKYHKTRSIVYFGPLFLKF